MNLFRTKNLSELLAEAKASSLEKTLGAWDLIIIGIGGIIGVGIFVVTGKIAALTAGPAITLSFVLAGVICICTALLYGELAAMIPITGGAYTFSYIVLGEMLAWLTGCCTLMVTALGSSIVSAGWSGYLVAGLANKGVMIPHALTTIPAEGGLVNLPAIVLTVLISGMLYKGTKESTKLNSILVFVKLAIIVIFLVAATPYFDIKHWENFMPFGTKGIITGAASMFIAFAGFEQIASAAEETKRPSRDMPIGIIGSVLIATVIYVLIAGVLTGIVDFTTLDNAQPMAYALTANGISIGSLLVTIGALAGMPAVQLMQIYSQSRVMFAMSRDGILPKSFSKIHPKNGTPYISVLITGAIIAVIGGFFPIELITYLMNIALLFTFAMVSVSVVIMRIKRPELHRPFKCPALFVLAGVSFFSSLYLVADLMIKNSYSALAFLACMGVAVVFYLVYGRKNSILNKSEHMITENVT